MTLSPEEKRSCVPAAGKGPAAGLEKHSLLVEKGDKNEKSRSSHQAFQAG